MYENPTWPKGSSRRVGEVSLSCSTRGQACGLDWYRLAEDPAGSWPLFRSAHTLCVLKKEKEGQQSALFKKNEFYTILQSQEKIALYCK